MTSCSCNSLRQPCGNFRSRVYEDGTVVCNACEHDHVCHQSQESLPASAAAGRIAPGLQDRPAGADEGTKYTREGLTWECLPMLDDLDPEINEVQP